MEIKRKVQKNLPQLIEWVIENKKFGCTYISNNFNKVYVTDDGIIEFSGLFYGDTFTVITFEEITEDTVLPRLVKHTYNSYYEHRDKSINMLDRAKEWSTFYYKDDNENMYLIWRDGKLVEYEN